jgi:heterodisulfide reductase subunit A-like polyferredoxin
MSKPLFYGKSVEQLGFDPQALEAKYEAEKQKRTREDGGAQYTELLEAFHHTANRDPVEKDVQVVIVGGGYGGLLCAVELIQKGVKNIVIVEKGGDFGGTWYFNKYPGTFSMRIFAPNSSHAA